MAQLVNLCLSPDRVKDPMFFPGQSASYTSKTERDRAG
jgi:hypothetical protein